MTWNVIDGDTFEMSVNGNTVTVRLANVGAPETYQPNGRLAAQKLQSLLANGTVEYKKLSVDSYGRWVCDVWNAQGVHINQAMRDFLGGYYGR